MSFNYKSLVRLVQWNWRYSWLCNANSDEVAGYWEQWDYQASRGWRPAGQTTHPTGWMSNAAGWTSWCKNLRKSAGNN